jgi:polysaccharide biosynthesis protein PelF
MTRPSVLLASEAAYPFERNDVSTWCHNLASELSEVDFTLLAVTRHPFAAPAFDVPANVGALINVPLWGTNDPAEFGGHDSFPDYLRRRSSMTASDIEQDYLPHYLQFLREVMRPSLPPRGLGVVLLQMHLHLRYYDYRKTHAHPAVWDGFVAVTQDGWRERYPGEQPPSLADLVKAWQLVSRLMLPLAVDVPQVGLAHSAAAGFCGLPCVIAKLRHRIPYVLTEHAVYVREQYLSAVRDLASPFVRWFVFRLVNTIADVNYALADQVVPVCDFNSSWAQRRGVAASRIRKIYNGVEPEDFARASRDERGRPTVVSIGDMLPLKGQLNLIECAAQVRRAIPDVAFRVYGAEPDAAYARQCRDLTRALELGDTVTFGPRPAHHRSVLHRGDVLAVPAVSESIPYALIGAMFGEAAVVATDVGGLREALGDTGMIVPAYDPASMADAIAELLRSPDSRRRLGQAARERAFELFTLARSSEAYRRMYDELLGRIAPVTVEEPGLVPAAAIA